MKCESTLSGNYPKLQVHTPCLSSISHSWKSLFYEDEVAVQQKLHLSGLHQVTDCMKYWPGLQPLCHLQLQHLIHNDIAGDGVRGGGGPAGWQGRKLWREQGVDSSPSTCYSMWQTDVRLISTKLRCTQCQSRFWEQNTFKTLSLCNKYTANPSPLHPIPPKKRRTKPHIDKTNN